MVQLCQSDAVGFPAGRHPTGDGRAGWLGDGNQLTGCIPQGWREIPINDLAELGLPVCGDG